MNPSIGELQPSIAALIAELRKEISEMKNDADKNADKADKKYLNIEADTKALREDFIHSQKSKVLY